MDILIMQQLVVTAVKVQQIVLPLPLPQSWQQQCMNELTLMNGSRANRIAVAVVLVK